MTTKVPTIRYRFHNIWVINDNVDYKVRMSRERYYTVAIRVLHYWYVNRLAGIEVTILKQDGGFRQFYYFTGTIIWKSHFNEVSVF